jgi:hypothetical protein
MPPRYPAKTLKANQSIKVPLMANRSPACSEKETASGSGFKIVDRMPTRILTAATRAHTIALAVPLGPGVERTKLSDTNPPSK